MIKQHDLRVGCEVGTGSGNMMAKVLPANPQLFMYLIAWYPGTREKETSNYSGPMAKRKFVDVIQPYKDRVKVIWKTSLESIKDITDGELDFVFIDADHSYEHAKQDIELWYPKVRSGGLVSGHDYDPTRPRMAGVIRAVDEYFNEFEIYEPDHVWYHWKSVT